MSGFVNKFKRMWDAPDDEYEYDDYDNYDDSEYVDSYYDESEPMDARDRRPQRRGDKVVDINPNAKLQVVVFKPQRFDDETRVIADELMKSNTVVLNLEDTNKDMSRRIIDFLSGVTYANHGKIQKVSSSTFIIIPSNVDLSGDALLDELESNGVYV